MSSSHDVFVGLAQARMVLTEDDIRGIFCHFGDILYVTIKQPCKSAHIRFAKKKAADLAVRQGESYINHIRKDIGRIKIGWANKPIISHAKLSNDSSSDSDSSSANENAFRKLDAAYKCITKTSWTCPDPGCREINNLENELCTKCNFRKDFPVARAKQMQAKTSPPIDKICDEKKDSKKEENKHFKSQIASLLTDTAINPSPVISPLVNIYNSAQEKLVVNKMNLDNQLKELQQSCLSVLNYRDIQELILIFQHELELRKNEGFETSDPTCDSVRRAYNFYIQCKEMLEKESEATSIKNKSELLKIAVTELAHKLRGRLAGFPIKDLEYHKTSIDKYLEKHLSEYKKCVDLMRNQDRKVITNEYILTKLTALKRSSSAMITCQDKEELSNQCIVNFAQSLSDASKYFMEFTSSNCNQDNRLRSEIPPNIQISLQSALENIQAEEQSFACSITRTTNVSRSEIEALCCLQEDHQQRCRLYMAHKVMATDLHNSYPNMDVFDPESLTIVQKEIEALRTSTPIRDISEMNLVDSNNGNIAERISIIEDKEVENILSTDNLMDSAWKECSVENKKERLKRLQDMFTPSIS